MLCNAAINIASIEGGELACAHTQNRKSWVRSQILYFGKYIFTKSGSSLFDIHPHFKDFSYLDENMLNYMYMYMYIPTSALNMQPFSTVLLELVSQQ